IREALELKRDSTAKAAAWCDASGERFGSAFSVVARRFFHEAIQLASPRVFLNLAIPHFFAQVVQPLGHCPDFFGPEPGDGCFDFLNRAHRSVDTRKMRGWQPGFSGLPGSIFAFRSHCSVVCYGQWPISRTSAARSAASIRSTAGW